VTETQYQYHTAPNSDKTPDSAQPPEYPGPHSELGDVVRTLLRSWWIIAICGVIALAVGVGVASRTASSYQGTAYVLLNYNSFQPAVTGSAPQINTQTAEATAIDMLTPQRQAEAAQAAGLRPSDTYGVSVNATANSNVLHINGTAASPRAAAALADAAAAQLIAAVKQANASSLSGARAAVQAQLAAAKRGQKQALASELNSFTTLEVLDDQSVELIQHALVPGVPSGPSKARDGGIALVLGLILGAALALLRPRREAVLRRP
jgi:uncharacterized protein involved in exopolysaccharide biosynthesis